MSSKRRKMLVMDDVVKEYLNKDESVEVEDSVDFGKSGESVFITQCRPFGLFKLLEDLNDDQKKAINDIGFGGLLSLSISHLNLVISKWLADSFNGTSRMFHIDGTRKFVVTEEDVHDVFCLPLSDTPVCKYGKSPPFEMTDYFLKKYGLGVRCKVNELLKVLKRLKNGCDDFKRLFVLYALTTFLAPSSNRVVKMSVSKSLADVSEIGNYNWCGYVFKHLCSAAEKYHRPKVTAFQKTRYFSGCCVLLQVLYFHRLVWHGVPEQSSIPLLQHWPNSKARWRSQQECIAGFGEGMLVKGVYPVTQKYMKVDSSAADELVVDDDDGENCLIFRLAEGDLKNSEIKKLAKNEVHEIILRFKRDISVVTRHSLARILVSTKVDDASKTKGVSEYFEDESVLRIIDEFVERVTRKWEKFVSSCGIPTPETPKDEPIKTSEDTVSAATEVLSTSKSSLENCQERV